ncbi:unnamed protein product [Schistosoma margrebowiei]|uniref:Uncharacterized protein n=1 Tax=Schistosoma margrebowiei TaxID=48269 RepID=A0A183LVT5_9TREM|nr:unnamed protein product [Schistosoma margrebowiei]
MVVGGSRQETLDPDFVLLGTHQQGYLIINYHLIGTTNNTTNITTNNITTTRTTTTTLIVNETRSDFISLHNPSIT